MHTYFVGHVTLLQIGVGFVFVLFRVLMAADLSEIEQLLAGSVRDALSAAHIEIKHAASCMRISDSQLAKQLRGEPGHFISLTRLIQLPFMFWLFFVPALISLVYKKRMQEMAEVLNDVRKA